MMPHIRKKEIWEISRPAGNQELEDNPLFQFRHPKMNF
jgi:hypothetical protein